MFISILWNTGCTGRDWENPFPAFPIAWFLGKTCREYVFASLWEKKSHATFQNPSVYHWHLTNILQSFRLFNEYWNYTEFAFKNVMKLYLGVQKLNFWAIHEKIQGLSAISKRLNFENKVFKCCIQEKGKHFFKMKKKYGKFISLLPVKRIVVVSIMKLYAWMTERIGSEIQNLSVMGHEFK